MNVAYYTAEPITDATMKKIITGVLLAVSSLASAVAATTWRSEDASAAALAARGIRPPGRVVLAKTIFDRDGEHMLLLTRSAGPSPDAPRSGRVELIALDAALYAKGARGWRADWTLHDEVDCPGLDSAADFFASAVTITDVNGDGKVEVTLPYTMFCGGGVDSATVKVVLREGPLKLAIRGQSQVVFPGQPPFGGEHALDKLLQAPAYAAYRRHLEQVWNAVSVDRRR